MVNSRACGGFLKDRAVQADPVPQAGVMVGLCVASEIRLAAGCLRPRSLMEVPISIVEYLASIEREMRRVVDYEISSELNRLMRVNDMTDKQRGGALAEFRAFSLHEPGESLWRTHFGPLSWPEKDGTIRQIPNLQEVADLIEYWELRGDEAEHPVLRARYCDLVWDLKEAATRIKPDLRFAHAAVDSYIAAADSKLYTQEVVGIRYLERALDLACRISDPARIRRAKDAMFRLYDLIAVPNQLGTWPFLFDHLYDNKHVGLDEAERLKIVAGLEDILERTSKPGASFEAWGAQEAALRLERHFKKTGSSEDCDRVIRTYGSAFEFLAKDADPGLALAWLQPVFEAYRNRGMADDAKRVQLAMSTKGKDLPASLRWFKVSQEIPPEKMEAYLASLVAGSSGDALSRVAAHFVPQKSVAKKLLEHSKSSAPVTSSMPTALVADGHIAAVVGPADADPDGATLMQVADNLKIQSFFLDRAMGRMVLQHQLSADAITEFLFQSPVYDPDRKTLIRAGVKCHFEGEYVHSVHILVPQVEHTLRRLLDMAGEPIDKPGRLAGTMDLKNLNDILREEKIRECLGEDLHLYFQALLSDKRGHNIRNRICHGLIPAEHITVTLSNRVIHVLLTLASIRERKILAQPQAP